MEANEPKVLRTKIHTTCVLVVLHVQRRKFVLFNVFLFFLYLSFIVLVPLIYLSQNDPILKLRPWVILIQGHQGG